MSEQLKLFKWESEVHECFGPGYVVVLAPSLEAALDVIRKEEGDSAERIIKGLSELEISEEPTYYEFWGSE